MKASCVKKQSRLTPPLKKTLRAYGRTEQDTKKLEDVSKRLALLCGMKV